MNISRFEFLKYPLIGLLLVIVGIWTNSYINHLPLGDDSVSNLKLANSIALYNVHGINTRDGDSLEIAPSYLREPVPAWILGQWIKWNSRLMNKPNLDLHQTNAELIKLKQVNVIIVMLMSLGVYCLARQLLASAGLEYKTSVYMALAVVVLCCACMHLVYATTLITEFHGALFIVWLGWAWLMAWNKDQLRYYALSGILVGLLILTKAAFMYIAIGTFVLLLLLLKIRGVASNLIVKQGLLILIAFLTVFPWLLRNHQQFGVWAIAGRGPVVLLTRAYMDKMNQDEFAGAFYAYAPASLKSVMREITGYSGKDRALGGRLQRFTRFYPVDEVYRTNRDYHNAISYYMKANIHWILTHEYYLKKYPDQVQLASNLAEKKSKQDAIRMISNNMGGHLKATLVLAWRGAWPCNKVDGRWYKHEKLQPAVFEIIPFIGLICMLVLGLKSVFDGNKTNIAISWLGCATFLFYALSTHFIPRYSEMMIPIWVLSGVYCTVLIVSKAKKNNQVKQALAVSYAKYSGGNPF